MSQIAGRLSIIQACAYDDTAMTSELRDVLGLLGTYSDQQGYCFPSQGALAERLGILRESVNRRIRRLAELGYVEIEHQFGADGGKRANRYRLVLDFRLPQDRWRIAPAAPDQDNGPSLDTTTHVREPRTSHVANPRTSDMREPRISDMREPVTTLNDPRERPKRTTQGNAAAATGDLIELPARARAHEDESGSGGRPSLPLERIAEAARMAPSPALAGIIDRHALNMPPADLIAESSKAAEWQADHPDKQPRMTLGFLDNWLLRARAATEEERRHAERSAASHRGGTGGRPRTAARTARSDPNDFGDLSDWLA